jgi:iron(III) transport system ATP-binding protein
MNQLQITGLSFKYKNQKDMLIENFNMDIQKGEIVSLIGASGSGKSTILRMICGLEKPTSGEVKLNNHILFGQRVNLQPQERGIGMIFQDYALFPHLTVLENVKFGAKGSKRERTETALACLELVKMAEHAQKYPHQCSGGQQQRIAIARAIAAKPEVLLLDEPFSSLDVSLRAEVRKDIRDIIKKANISAILVTHDHEDVKACADRAIELAS